VTSLDQAAKEFILSCEAEGLKETTIRWYQSILTRFVLHHPGANLEEVDAHQIRLYLKGLRTAEYAPDSVNDYTRALHRFWRWVHQEYDLRNPMRSIRYPQQLKVRTPKAVSIEAVIAMFHAAQKGGMSPTRDMAILAFALDTGCRAGGICTLLRRDVDLKLRRAIVTEKGDKTRVVPFSKVTAALLEDWIDERNEGIAVFFYSLSTWEALRPNSLYLLFKRIARRAGLRERANPHAWRHRFSISYIQAGGDIYTLSRILGHESVDTTARHYAIFTDQEVSEAHEKYSPINSLDMFKQEKDNDNVTE